MSRTKLLAIALLLTLGAGWWVFHEPGQNWPIVNEHPAATNVLAFGDSLTAGYGAPAGQGYVDVLSRRLGVPIVNRGVSGNTTDDALLRLQADVIAAKPGLVILMLGGNDMLQKRDEERTFANLKRIIQESQQAGALVVLAGFDFPLRSRYARRYRTLAEETGCVFVPDMLDGILGHSELMSDSVHPNAQGYERMADKLEPILRQHLGK